MSARPYNDSAYQTVNDDEPSGVEIDESVGTDNRRTVGFHEMFNKTTYDRKRESIDHYRVWNSHKCKYDNEK